MKTKGWWGSYGLMMSYWTGLTLSQQLLDLLGQSVCGSNIQLYNTPITPFLGFGNGLSNHNSL